jgi:ribosomal protein S17E
MKKNEDKKVALKLINQYADEVTRVQDENKILNSEILDLKTNLKINKQIIEGLMKGDLTHNCLFKKMNEEISILNNRQEKISSENKNLNLKITFYEKVFNRSTAEYRENTESLHNKIFILENSILKKDNIIISLKKKIEASDATQFERELYVKYLY